MAAMIPIFKLRRMSVSIYRSGHLLPVEVVFCIGGKCRLVFLCKSDKNLRNYYNVNM